LPQRGVFVSRPEFSTGISILGTRLRGEFAGLASGGLAPYIRRPDFWSPPMAYAARDDRPADKAARYAEVEAEILAVLDGEPNRTARMATVASMLADAFPVFFWTGFYVVDPDKADELVVGPYQGTLGCLRIAFGRGVCGAAARDRATQVVDDVHAFPGHIACDSRSASEIVVPVFDPSGHLIAVFDVDATVTSAFDAADAYALERLMARVFG
jgi:L-methionine (R)-S-oxide reductase